MRLIDADEYKGKFICNHSYSGVTKLIEIDSVPTAFDLGCVIDCLKEKCDIKVMEHGIDGAFRSQIQYYEIYGKDLDTEIKISDVIDILKSAVNIANE